MLILSIKLVLAHLIGDFVLQPDSWVKAKENEKFKPKYLYYHIGIHALLLILLLQFQLKYSMGIIFILVTHFLFDLGKMKFQKKNNKIILFFIDQLLHLLVITAVVYYYTPFSIETKWLDNPKIGLAFVALIGVTQVAAITIKVLLSKWNMKDKNPNNAGKYIGMIERLFILGFVIMNYWEGIGFLLAAKSVFRFGDLNNSKDRNLTEYVLIGTLLSFGIAIIIAGIFKYLIGL